MTTAAATAFEIDYTQEPDLQHHYNEEEREAIFVAYADACGAGEHEKAMQIVKHLPVEPEWAKIIADVYGKEFLLEGFNITHANEVFGEGWLDGYK